MVLGEGRHHLRVPDDEGGGDAQGFDEFANELVEQACIRPWLAALNIVLFEGSQNRDRKSGPTNP